MKLFKRMSEIESSNWNTSAIIGFYTYMILLFIDQTYNLLFADNLLSTAIIFWVGLIVAFGFRFILNLVKKEK